MKKRLLAAAVAASLTLSLSAALAAPVEFDGEVEVHYQWDDHDADGDAEGARNTVILNAKTALTENVDFYTRFTAQRYHGDDITADFNTRNGTRKSTATIDRFGFILKSDAATYNLGRQGADLGPNALLYSTSGNIGSSTTLVDGLTADATVGATALNFIAGQETDTENNVYALHAAYNLNDAWTVGGTLAKYDKDAAGEKDTNHWGIDTAYTNKNTTYFAEYAKSNANDNDKAFVAGLSYELDDKNSFGLAYAKVEQNGDMGGNTDFDNGYKGLYFSYDHKLTDNTTLSFAYSDLKDVDTDDKYNYVETTVNFAF